MAEEELIPLKREVVLSALVDDPTSITSIACLRISLPYSVFFDGFGLYRNKYQSLKSMYITPAGLDIDQQSKLSHIFAFIIGPFESDKLNMAACMAANGITMEAGKMLVLESGQFPSQIHLFLYLFTSHMN